MRDVVFVERLEVDAVIGVYDWEQSVRQRLLVDVHLSCDASAAAAEDDISLAIDYARVAGWIRETTTARSWKLVETVAVHLAEGLLREFGVVGVRVAVRKPGAVPGTASVGVMVARGDCTMLPSF